MGGATSTVHRITLRMPSGAETAFVLRQLQDQGAAEVTALHTGATLEALRRTPVPAEELLWLDADGHVFGRPALATTLVGESGAGLPAAGTALTRLVEALVTLQWVPGELVEHLPRLATPRDLARWALDTPPVIDPTVAAITEFVVSSADRVAPQVPVLRHGALGPSGVRRSGDDIGFVDWRHAVVADPRADVSRVALEVSLVHGLDVGDRLVTAYEQVRGPVEDRWWFDLVAGIEASPATDPVREQRLEEWTARALAAAG